MAIGIELIRAARGQGLGAEAQRLIADYLFAATDLNRVEASTDVANTAEQRALDKAGYRHEGVIRRAQFRAGAYHDLAYYSRLRDDPADAPAAAPVRTSTARGMLPVGGQLVRLRDVTVDDAEMLDGWFDQREPGSFNDLGQARKQIPLDVLANGPMRDGRRGTVICERLEDGAPVGSLSWHVVGYGPNPESQCFNIGIELLAWARGKGYGTESQRLLADWLLEASEVNRVEASTDIENVPEQRALEKAGFTRDGTIRGSQFRAGGYHDLVVYSRLRGDA